MHIPEFILAVLVAFLIVVSMASTVVTVWVAYRAFREPVFRARVLRILLNVLTAPQLLIGWCAARIAIRAAPMARSTKQKLVVVIRIWGFSSQMVGAVVAGIGWLLRTPFRITLFLVVCIARWGPVALFLNWTQPVWGPKVQFLAQWLGPEHVIGFIIRRAVLAALIFLVISFGTFMLGRFGPGDPVLSIAHPGASEETIERLRENLGFNDPVLVQYANYMTDFFQGDFGTSLVQYQDVPVTELLAPRLEISAQLFGVVLPLIFGIGMALGIFAALRHRTPWDPVAISAALVFQSLHPLIFVPLLIWVFVLIFEWLPAAGWDPIFHVGVSGSAFGILCLGSAGFLSIASIMKRRFPGWRVGILAASLGAIGISALFFSSVGAPLPYPVFPKRMWIPVLSLVLPGIGGVARLMRIALLNEMSRDYVRTARAKGLPEFVILYRHVMRNAMLLMWTVIGLSLVSLVGGAFFVEYLYGIPGIGRLSIEAVFARDYDIILAVTLISAGAFLFLQLVIDIGYSIIDPRIRLSASQDY